MFSGDFSDITFSSGSRLLSESPILPSSQSSSHSHTGPGGDDLSLSELSLSYRPTPQPSSSLGDNIIGDSFNDDSADGQCDEVETPDGVEQTRRQAAKLREEKLHRDLFILKKLNASFASFNDALKDTQTGTERVTEQLGHTNALLDKYVNILAKSDAVARLIFDERWEGAEQDEESVDREQKELEQKACREAEERALAAQRERERIEREERTAREREEKERIDMKQKEKLGLRGGIRGVRGTRASMRGIRGASATATRGGTTTTTRATGSVPTGRPPSAASRGAGTATRGSRRS